MRTILPYCIKFQPRTGAQILYTEVGDSVTHKILPARLRHSGGLDFCATREKIYKYLFSGLSCSEFSNPSGPIYPKY